MKRLRLKLLTKPGDLFDEIWAEYYPKITVFLRTSFGVGSPEDLVQEIMLKVFKNLGSYSPAYSFNTWIYSIARNHAIDAMKKEDTARRTMKAVRREAETSPWSGQTPETILLDKQLRLDIAGYIENLPGIEREISFLKFHENLKYKQISRITGIPAGTVKYHVHNIKSKFADYYGEHYED